LVGFYWSSTEDWIFWRWTNSSLKLIILFIKIFTFVRQVKNTVHQIIFKL
jgi:hypothetical protein